MKNYSSEWIHKLENLKHWNYYWYQVRDIRDVSKPEDKILEIGVGTRFTSNYLKSKDYDVTTIDIDPDKKPDIVANVSDYQFEETFTNVMAFEVFEHIPFDDFQKILAKIHTICTGRLLISLPRNEKVWFDMNIELPGSRQIRFRLATRRNKILSRHHHWEIDYKQYTNTFLAQVFADHGFAIEKMERVKSLYYYTLKKV